MSNKRLLKLAENPVAEEDDDDLESLLGDESDEEDEPSLKEEIAEMRKSQTETAKIMLSLTRSLSAIAKHVMALQSSDEEEELEATTSTPDSEEDVMEKGESATESDFSPYGSSDLGEPDEGVTETPAMSAASSERAASDPGLVSLKAKSSQKSVVRKDDSSSNFGQKDSDIPGNPPVTPDTKDWPADQSVIPHSGLSPTLKKEIAEIRAALVSAGIIKKAQSPTPGVRTEEKALDLQALEDRARNMTHRELNHWRIACGELPAGIV